jgi:hypothetical protein
MTADEHSDVHERALKRFRASESASRDQRKQALEDRRFCSVSGAMWEGPYELQYENKPRLEVNKVHLAVIRIFNEYRNNRMDVLFTPKTGEKADKLADACAAVYRADEEDSCGEEAFDNGFDEAVTGGFGGWRVRACYEDEEDAEDERQRLRIEPIHDADGRLFFDVDAKRQDKSDSKHAFLLVPMTHVAYEEEYDDDPASWPKSEWNKDGFDWCTPDVVYVCEYYEIEERRDTVEVWSNLVTGEELYKLKSVMDASPQDAMREELRLTGHKIVRRKKIKKPAVHKWVLSGSKILEDCDYIAGKHIPLVPVYGKRWYIDNVERFMGHVRLCKDAQRLKNIMLSKLAEIAGKSSVEKPIFHPEQVAGHEVRWSEDNIKDYPYMLVNPMTDAGGQMIASGPIAYTKPPIIPEALAALLQITEQDMKDILGNQEQGEEMQSNISGKVVELIQQKLDMQSFIYVDNMKKAIRRTGQIWLSAAKEIYVETGRKMKGITRAGETTPIEIGRETIVNGVTVPENDFSEAEFDSRVEVGPTTASRRQSIVRSLTAILQITTDPQDQQVLQSMIFANMEGEGLSDVRRYYRKKMIKMGVVEPTKEEASQAAEDAKNAPPDPNSEYLKAAAEQATAEAMQARANVVLKVGQTEKTKAETVKILSEVDHQQQTQAMEIIDRVSPNLMAPATTATQTPTTEAQ